MMTTDAETDGCKLGRMARFYDMFDLSGVVLRKVSKVSGPKPGEQVLDVGCGTGTLALLLADAVGDRGHVTAVDAAAGMIEVARNKAAQAGVEIDFRVAAIERLPFADESFDRVYATLMVHHLPKAVKQAGFAEVHRVLRPGGEFLVVDYGPPPSLFWRAMSVPIVVGEKLIADGESVGSMLRGELPDYLREAGFARVNVTARAFGIIEFVVSRKER